MGIETASPNRCGDVGGVAASVGDVRCRRGRKGERPAARPQDDEPAAAPGEAVRPAPSRLSASSIHRSRSSVGAWHSPRPEAVSEDRPPAQSPRPARRNVPSATDQEPPRQREDSKALETVDGDGRGGEDQPGQADDCRHQPDACGLPPGVPRRIEPVQCHPRPSDWNSIAMSIPPLARPDDPGPLRPPPWSGVRSDAHRADVPARTADRPWIAQRGGRSGITTDW